MDRKVLVSLPDGQQVAIMLTADGEVGRVIHRRTPSACWGPSLDKAADVWPHERNTYHVGDW